MEYTNVFKRYEIKYLVTDSQKQAILDGLGDSIVGDRWGRSNVRSLYFDTPDFLLIRRSIEKPVYREKLRLRSYGMAHGDSPVFVEIKKKYDSVVYKRRFSLSEDAAMAYVHGDFSPESTQITRETDRFLSFYAPIEARVLITCDREAYFSESDPELRLTFDSDILYRTDDLSLHSQVYGKPLLEKGMNLLEIKTAGAIPLELVRLLSAQRLYKTTFSKYGLAYKDMLLNSKGAKKSV